MFATKKINNREFCESMKVLKKLIMAVVHICSNHDLDSCMQFYHFQ